MQLVTAKIISLESFCNKFSLLQHMFTAFKVCTVHTILKQVQSNNSIERQWIQNDLFLDLLLRSLWSQNHNVFNEDLYLHQYMKVLSYIYHFLIDLYWHIYHSTPFLIASEFSVLYMISINVVINIMKIVLCDEYLLEFSFELETQQKWEESNVLSYCYPILIFWTKPSC